MVKGGRDDKRLLEWIPSAGSERLQRQRRIYRSRQHDAQSLDVGQSGQYRTTRGVKMIDLSYKPKTMSKKTEPEEIAICIFGALVLIANMIAFLAAL